MIKFDSLLLTDSLPLQFSLLWRGDDLDWNSYDIQGIEFRQGDRTDSKLLATGTPAVSQLDPKILVITLTVLNPPMPNGRINYDILLTNGIRLGFGSIEIQRGITA